MQSNGRFLAVPGKMWKTNEIRAETPQNLNQIKRPDLENNNFKRKNKQECE